MKLDDIAKAFTRFFVPGLTLLTIGLLLPAVLVHVVTIEQLERFLSPTNILVGAIILGYLLDAIRGYRGTFHWWEYMRCKRELTQQLNKIVDDVLQNPDDFVARLWLVDKDTYDRIFQERAEWVMIMETSLALLVSGFLLFAGTMVRWSELPQPLIPLCLSVVMWLVSYLGSSNGIVRMRSHDRKLIAAVRRYQESSVTDASSH